MENTKKLEDKIISQIEKDFYFKKGGLRLFDKVLILEAIKYALESRKT